MPKMVEIDEEQLLRDKNLRAQVERIMGNPDARLLVEQAAKLVDPNAKTPTLDQKKIVEEPVSKLEAKMDAFIAAQNKDREEREAKAKREEIHNQVTSGLARLRAAGWTDDGVKGVEKLMEEKGLLDVDIAAAFFEKQHPPQAPIKSGGTGAWNFLDQAPEGDADLKKLVENRGQSEGLIDKMAMDALAEIRGQSRR
jgi:hypothetical protein